MRKADNLPPPCAVVTKLGNLNFLEPSGPLRACNGTALPLPFTVLWALYFCCVVIVPWLVVNFMFVCNFAVSRDPCVQVQYTAVNTNSFSPCLKKAPKMSSLGSQTRVAADTLFVARRSFVS